MKFKVLQGDLINALQLTAAAVERRGTLPIISNVLLSITDDTLHITGTDLEIETVTSISIKDAQEGSVTVPAKKLFDIVRALPSDSDIAFTFNDGDKATVRSGRGRYTLQTLNAKDFPNLDEFTATQTFAVNTSDLSQLLASTVFAMAQNDVRYFLNGLLLHINEGVIRGVATDGHRLAYSALHAECDAISDTKLILPRKGVSELQKILSMAGEQVMMSLSDNHLRVTCEHITFTTKLVDGNYPDYNRVIPQNGDKTLVLEKAEIKAALSRAAILSNEKFRGVRLIIKDGLMEIEANNPEQEEAKEVVDVISQQGDTLEVGFNVNYLLDAINTIESDQVKFTLGNAGDSALIESSTPSNSLFVCMPMRL